MHGFRQRQATRGADRADRRTGGRPHAERVAKGGGADEAEMTATQSRGSDDQAGPGRKSGLAPPESRRGRRRAHVSVTREDTPNASETHQDTLVSETHEQTHVAETHRDTPLCQRHEKTASQVPLRASADAAIARLPLLLSPPSFSSTVPPSKAPARPRKRSAALPTPSRPTPCRAVVAGMAAKHPRPAPTGEATTT